MQLDYLKYLIAIKEHGSMNRAAKHLYVSQQNISKTIKRLEEEFGYPIFVPGTRKCVFTKEGERLYAYAVAYEKKRKELRNQLAKQSLRNINGTVRIGAMSTASTMVLPQVLATHYKNYPNIKLEICDGDLSTLLSMLMQNEVDMAVVLMVQVYGEDCIPMPEQIRSRTIAECRTCCWMSKQNPLAKRKDIAMQELTKEPVVASSKSDLTMMREIYKNYNSELILAAEDENPYLLGKLTAGNMGVFFDVAIEEEKWMMRYIFENSDEVTPLPVQLESGYRSKLCLLTNRQKEKTVLEKHIVNFILDGKWKE